MIAGLFTIGTCRTPFSTTQCLHGFPECWYSFRWFLQAFSGSHHVVAVDMRGYGLTAKTESSWWSASRDYNLGVLAEDVKALVHALGHNEINVLVGHDWGAIVAWAVLSANRGLSKRAVILSVPHPVLFRLNLGVSQVCYRSCVYCTYVTFTATILPPHLAYSLSIYRILSTACTT